MSLLRFSRAVRAAHAAPRRGIAAAAATRRSATAVELYRRVVRSLPGLPPSAQDYYRDFAREHIESHADEDEPERLAALLQRGDEYVDWVRRKYDMGEERRRA